ncbi:MAG: 2OG-Fe(II) oxygenase family protein [Gammaproteobacteria bacterium]
MLAGALAARAHFVDDRVIWIGITIDPKDEDVSRVVSESPHLRLLWDFDGAASRRFGALGPRGDLQAALARARSGAAPLDYQPHSLILDRQLRVLDSVLFDVASQTPQAHVASILARVAALPAREPAAPAVAQAPVLVLPRVFEPELCRRLIEHYDAHGGQASGFMQDRDGMTVLVSDPSHKRRRDREIDDPVLQLACRLRIQQRILLDIERAFQFRATRIERYLVGCYDAAEGGHFRAHRDNTTRGTAHRRFAVSLHLNTGEYEGGHLRFPEFGDRLYSAPPGGAVIFSCSMMHEATPVTRGRRYMFLPFLYDDAAAEVRERNLSYVGRQ